MTPDPEFHREVLALPQIESAVFPAWAADHRTFEHARLPGVFHVVALVDAETARFEHETAEIRDRLGRPVSQGDLAGVYPWADMRLRAGSVF